VVETAGVEMVPGNNFIKSIDFSLLISRSYEHECAEIVSVKSSGKLETRVVTKSGTYKDNARAHKCPLVSSLLYLTIKNST
jgi:hypothetical protein